MKRLVLISILMLPLVSFAQAGLDGTWNNTTSETEKNEKQKAESEITMSADYTFKGDTYSIVMHCLVNFTSLEKEASLNIKVTGSHSGTLKREGDRLTLIPDKKKKPEVEVTSSADGLKGGNLVKTLLSGPLKREVSNAMKIPESYRIVSLTDTELVLEDILDPIETKRGETPEIETFTRQ